MKELVIISGKGGTGKTSLTAAIAGLAENSILCDADVDAADLHLLLTPDIQQCTDFKSGAEAEIHSEKCTQCGLCVEMCRFNAIKDDFVVDGIQCEGCGVCVYFCPEQAITFNEKTCGQWFVSKTRFGPMVHAKLGIAEENSGKLVTLVRQQAKKIATEKALDLIITDGPPGIGCPVIASLGGADAVLIVTEPTVSGIHDMDRVAQLAEHFKIPTLVCINKYDLNMDQTHAIKQFAEKKGLKVVGEIPFDKEFVESMIAQQTIVEYNPNSETAQAVKKIWENLYNRHMKQEA